MDYFLKYLLLLQYWKIKIIYYSFKYAKILEMYLAGPYSINRWEREKEREKKGGKEGGDRGPEGGKRIFHVTEGKKNNCITYQHKISI